MKAFAEFAQLIGGENDAILGENDTLTINQEQYRKIQNDAFAPFIPKGYLIVETGVVEPGDLVFVVNLARVNLYPGWEPIIMDENGLAVSNFAAVCRTGS